jgi:hypothetical protein
LIEIDMLAVRSSLRFGWRMSDQNSAPEVERHYKLSFVSLVLLKGRSVRPNILIIVKAILSWINPAL